MERIFSSINYIEEHMFEAISVHDIAKSSNLSTYHYCRVFKSIVGDSPKEYLRKRRLTLAATRLLKEDIALSILLLTVSLNHRKPSPVRLNSYSI